MKKLFFLLVGVIIFVSAASSAMAVNTTVEGKVTGFTTAGNGQFVNIYIEKVNGFSEHCWCYPDNALLDLAALAFQTQSVCTFIMAGNSGSQLLDIYIFSNKSITNANLLDEVRHSKTCLEQIIRSIKAKLDKIYNIVRAIYRRV